MKRIILLLIIVLIFISACNIKDYQNNKECGECPQLTPPAPDFCEEGTIIPGEVDKCGCRGPPNCQIDNSHFEEDTGNVYVKYENGILDYKVTIEKPTLCHTIKKEELVTESYPVQVAVDLTLESSNEICIQVTAEETIEGTINVGHKPGSFTIRLEDELIYSSNLKY